MPVNIGQATFDSIVIETEPLVIQAEQVKHRCVKVVNRRDVLDGLVAEFVGGSVTESTFHSGAGHPHGESFRVMIATVRIFLERWHATKFRNPENKCIVEQTAGFHIFDQCRGGLIEDWRVDIVLFFELLVSIPIANTFAHGVGTIE